MAGRKSKKTPIHSIELKDGNKTMTISFDEKGDCKIIISSGYFGMIFNICEELTHLVRLLFWDNYRRHHVWKTKKQLKAEKLLENVQPVQDISFDNDIFPLDLNTEFLLDIPYFNEKKTDKSI
jgi:hypothetical protein